MIDAFIRATGTTRLRPHGWGACTSDVPTRDAFRGFHELGSATGGDTGGVESKYLPRLSHEGGMKLVKTHYVRKRFYALLNVYFTIYAEVLLINILPFKYLTPDYATRWCYYYYYYDFAVTINYYVTAV